MKSGGHRLKLAILLTVTKQQAYSQKDLDCDMAKFSIAVPQPGSELFMHYEQQLLNDFHPETCNSWHCPKKGDSLLTVVPGGLLAKTLSRLQTIGMLMFYLKLKVIARHTLKGTLTIRDMMKGAFFFLKHLMRSTFPS